MRRTGAVRPVSSRGIVYTALTRRTAACGPRTTREFGATATGPSWPNPESGRTVTRATTGTARRATSSSRTMITRGWTSCAFTAAPSTARSEMLSSRRYSLPLTVSGMVLRITGG